VRRLVWSGRARRDIREIVTYIAARNPRAAARVAERIELVATSLAPAPTGRRGRVAGTYEKVLPGLPYILAYALETAPDGEEILAVLRVIHGARNWPEGTWPKD
jgi:toxin ParE1/3/4